VSEIKVISFGAAVQDVFLSGKALTPTQEDNGQWMEQLPLGAKLDLDNIVFSTGGGATNGSVTFARHGLKAGFVGQIGHDPAGEAVVQNLRREHVDIDLVIYSDEFATGYSVLLLAPSGERTILTYRGASTHYDTAKFRLNDAHGDWYFVTSLAGNMDLLEHIINHAHERHIKVALIPGKGELAQAERLKRLLPKITILSANKEETKNLFNGDNPWELAKSGAQQVPYLVVTDGPNGVVATDRDKKIILHGGMYEDVPVIDRTGAGDAFASGFTAAIADGGDLQRAVTFASANSTSVVSHIGAKEGILQRDAQLHDMDLHVDNL